MGETKLESEGQAMNTVTRRVFVWAVVVLLVTAGRAGAQSMDVTGRANGLRLGGYSLWEEDSYHGSGAGFAYGIAGLLDVGFDVGVLYDELEGVDAQESRMTFLLRGLLARQTQGFPISVTLDFTYHFSVVQSDYLQEQFTDFDLQRDGRGYSVGGAAWRDFWLLQITGVRIGAGARMRVERYTTRVASGFDPDSDAAVTDPLTRYPKEEMSRRFGYELSAGPLFRLPNGNFVLSGLVTVRHSQENDVSALGEVGVTFLRPQ